MPAFSGAAGFFGGQEQADAAEEAAKLQRDVFRQVRTDAEPFRLLGTDAANFLRGLFFDQGPSAGLFSGETQETNPELARLRAQLEGTPEFITRRLGPTARLDEQGRPTHKSVANPRFNELQQLIAGTPEFIGGGGGGEPLNFGEVVREFDPTFAFRQEEGEKAKNRALSSRGLFRSGRALKALNEFNSNLALGSAENFLNRLASFAGLGQTTAATTGSQGITSAGIRGDFLTDEAAAKASSFNAIGNALANTAGGVVLGGI